MVTVIPIYKAAILCIGTELTIGKNLDTNSKYIANKLFLLGIEVSAICNLPDSHSIIKEYLAASLKNNDIIILTGGLGPTQDDITKDAVKDAMHLETEYSKEIFQGIEQRFKRRGYKIPECNKSQAIIFKDSIVLKNKAGTAPGFIIEKNNKKVILLPGPPVEMTTMMESDVLPYLDSKFKMKFYHQIFKIAGLPESQVSEKLDEIDKSIKKLKGDLTYLARPNLIEILVSSKYNIEKIKKIASEIKNIFFENIYADKQDDIYNIVCSHLLKKKLSFSIAESCTGGLVGKTITDIPGSSEYFKFGLVCYSNESKIKILKVNKELLDKHGAVSEEVALGMLQGLQKIINTDVSVSITGIAGPSGGTKEKPVGMVYIGIKFKKDTEVYKFIFPGGNREKIRNFTLNKVFELLYKRFK